MALLKDAQLEILVSIGSGNGLVPIRHQAHTLTNATLTSVRPSKAYKYEVYMWKSYHKYKILSTLYAVLTQFFTRFTACTGGILVSVIEARLLKLIFKWSTWEIYHVHLSRWNLRVCFGCIWNLGCSGIFLEDLLQFWYIHRERILLLTCLFISKMPQTLAEIHVHVYRTWLLFHVSVHGH